MKSFAFKSVTIFGCLATLIASGGSGGGGEVTQTPKSLLDTYAPNGVSETQYKSLLDTTGTTEGTIQVISAPSVRTENTVGEVPIEQATFEYYNASGGLNFVLNGVTYAATESLLEQNHADLYRGGGEGTGLDGTIYLNQIAPRGRYQYVTDVTIFLDSSPRTKFTGFIGDQTLASEMPSQGTVTYRGKAEGHFIRADGTASVLTGGSAKIDAQFGTGIANVSASGFNDNYAEVDMIKGKRIAIVGSSLTGGNWTSYKDSTENVLGIAPDAQTVATGGFYGFDPTKSAPDEVGVTVQKYDASGVGFSISAIGD